MMSLFSIQRKQDEFPTVKSIRQSVLRLSAKLSSLKKLPYSSDKLSLITDFLNQPYVLPRVFVSKGRIVVSSETGDIVAAPPALLVLK